MDNDQAMTLIQAYLDETATPEEILALAAWLRENPENAREFARIGSIHRGLFDHFRARNDLMESPVNSQDMAETMILPALQVEDTPAPRDSVELFSLTAPHVWNRGTTPGRGDAAVESTGHRLSPKRQLLQLLWIAASIMLILSGVGILIFLTPKSPVTVTRLYGHIVATVNPQWSGPLPRSFQNGIYLPRRELLLTHGLVQIQMADGVTTVFQAPAEFRFHSNSRLDLVKGKVTVAVPHDAVGFSVYSPHSVVTDLGTSFGIMVGRSGKSTRVVVFKGRVAAESLNHIGRKIRLRHPRIVSQGQDAELTAKGINLGTAEKLRIYFVRSLVKRPLSLSLVDLMTGGTGLGVGHRIEIDPLTGSAGHFPPISARAGNGIYHEVSGIPIVDGCFVPGSSTGPDQVDSAGQRFKFPTSVNATFGNISAGGKIPWIKTPPDLPIKLTLHGVNYSRYPHRLIVIHSNSGLTLNLDAIRKLYPGIPIGSFHCIVGDSFVGTDKYAHLVNPKADIFVLVDGKVAYQKLEITGKMRPLHVRIPLPQNAHFLTLVTTDGGDGFTDDWVLWCDPEFRLIPKLQ